MWIRCRNRGYARCSSRPPLLCSDLNSKIKPSTIIALLVRNNSVVNKLWMTRTPIQPGANPTPLVFSFTTATSVSMPSTIIALLVRKFEEHFNCQQALDDHDTDAHPTWCKANPLGIFFHYGHVRQIVDANVLPNQSAVSVANSTSCSTKRKTSSASSSVHGSARRTVCNAILPLHE